MTTVFEASPSAAIVFRKRPIASSTASSERHWSLVACFSSPGSSFGRCRQYFGAPAATLLKFGGSFTFADPNAFRSRGAGVRGACGAYGAK